MSPWQTRNDPTATSLIRDSITNHLLNNTNTKWGFVIIRGSYASQERWEKFLSLIKEDTREYLCERIDPMSLDRKDGADLWDSLEWTVLEDEKTLDEASHKLAREHFDEWARKEIERVTEGVDISEYAGNVTSEDRFRLLTARQPPRRRFFVFVDEEALDSVVDCDALNDRGKLGGYYVWVVKSGLSENLVETEAGMEKEGDEDWEDPEEVHEEGWCMSRQKFHAWDLVVAYASILQGDWPDGYMERDEADITQVTNL